jgi:hypothetical protein
MPTMLCMCEEITSYAVAPRTCFSVDLMVSAIFRLICNRRSLTAPNGLKCLLVLRFFNYLWAFHMSFRALLPRKLLREILHFFLNMCKEMQLRIYSYGSRLFMWAYTECCLRPHTLAPWFSFHLVFLSQELTSDL